MSILYVFLLTSYLKIKFLPTNIDVQCVHILCANWNMNWLVLSIYRIYLKFDSRSRFLSNQSFSDQQISLFLIWLRCIFWPLQLNFKSFHTNLEAIHSLNGCLCTGGVIKTNKSEALALVGGSVDEDFAADNISKGKEHLHQLCISKLLRQMINEKVASFWSTYGATYKRSVLYLIYSFNFSTN